MSGDASVEAFPFSPPLWDHCAIQVHCFTIFQTMLGLVWLYVFMSLLGCGEDSLCTMFPPWMPWESDQIAIYRLVTTLTRRILTRHDAELIDMIDIDAP